MLDSLWRNALQVDQALTWDVLFLRQFGALLMGCVVAGTYHYTRNAALPRTRSILATLVLLTVLIAMISSVIGDNVARAFALVGALSIVRFRTVVQDTRDTAFVIYAVGAGMAVGTGHIMVAVVCAPFVAISAHLFRHRTPVQAAQPYLLKVRVDLDADVQAIEQILAEKTDSFQAIAFSTARQGVALDLSYRLSIAGPRPVRDLLNHLVSRPEILSVEIELLERELN